MVMKKLYFMLAALVVCSTTMNAQFFQRVINSAKTQAEVSVEKQVDKKVDEGIDRLFNGKKKQENTQQTEQVQQPQQDAGWVCMKCGKMGNTGKFCSDCGAKRPEVGDGSTWTCTECGHTGNNGNFCAECGAKRPSATPAEVAPATPSVPAMPTVPAAPVEMDMEQGMGDMMGQISAWQALGCLTPEEIAHLKALAEKLESMPDDQAGMYLLGNAEEMTFLMSIQMKVYQAMYGSQK